MFRPEVWAKKFTESIFIYIVSHLIFAILCKESSMYYSITLIRKLRLKEYYIMPDSQVG